MTEKRTRGRPTSASPPPDTFAHRLRQARLQLGATRGQPVGQEEFAALVAAHLNGEFHQSRLSRLETGISEPTLGEAMACALAAGVDVTWLSYGFHAPIVTEPTPVDQDNDEAPPTRSTNGGRR